MTKKSSKVRQTFDTAQDDAGENDKIVFAANAYRERSVSDREWIDPVNSDALMILTGLGTVFVTTTTLFRIWSLSRERPEAAREYLLRLHGGSPGIFSLEAKGQGPSRLGPKARSRKARARRRFSSGSSDPRGP